MGSGWVSGRVVGSTFLDGFESRGVESTDTHPVLNTNTGRWMFGVSTLARELLSTSEEKSWGKLMLSCPQQFEYNIRYILPLSSYLVGSIESLYDTLARPFF